MRAEGGAAGLDLHIDSAGTGDWHVGHPPDRRAQAEALRNGIDISHYRARQVQVGDFCRFGMILALDGSNLADLRAMAPPGSPAKVSLLLDHVDGMSGRAVPDPYYGDASDFAETWRLVSQAARAIVVRLGA